MFGWMDFFFLGANVLARCAWRPARHQRDPNRREGEECTPGSCVPAVQPRSFVQITHTDLTESVRQMGGRGEQDRQKRVNGIFIWETEGRKDHWYLCVDASQQRSLYINVLILNRLWGSQRLWKNGGERNRKQSGRTEGLWLQNVTGLLKKKQKKTWLRCFFFLSFSPKWWQMFKLKWKTSKTVFKWLFIGMLVGLTLCPLVSGDRKLFLFNVLF